MLVSSPELGCVRSRRVFSLAIVKCARFRYLALSALSEHAQGILSAAQGVFCVARALSHRVHLAQRILVTSAVCTLHSSARCTLRSGLFRAEYTKRGATHCAQQVDF